MAILTVQDLAKAHGLKQLFTGISFGVEDRARIGIIGANGSGKSTLLKIVAGTETADSGMVTRRSDLRVMFLPQKPEFDPAATVIEHVLGGTDPAIALVREFEVLSHRIELHPEDEALHRQLDDLTPRMDAAGAWEVETRAHVILGRLGVLDLESKLGELSGGYRKRVALAQALLSDADLLILDEPTNHLDADMIAWLEEALSRHPGAVMVVTHDRYFLDNVTRQIFEIDRGELRRYEGNFSYYIERKAELEEQDAARDARQRGILRNELAWLRRGAKARSTKQKARVQRAEAMRDEPAAVARETLKFETLARRLGGKIIEMEGVSKSFGDKICVADFTHVFKRGERLGVIGPNGCGKTTLVNLITGAIKPDSGTIEVGGTIAFGYYDQESRGLDPAERAIDYVKREGGEMLRAPDGAQMTAASVMERFLFTPQMLYAPIGKLSGGEQRRLYLVRTLMRDPNFLILDEPTNDLDIATLQALEDYLDGFTGCVLVISHDRYFIDRSVEHVLAYDGEGRWRTYPGGYTIYAEMRAEELATAKAGERSDAARAKVGAPPAGTPPPAPVEKSAAAAPPAAKPKKLSQKEQRELKEFETGIAKLEARIEALNAEIAAAGADYARLQKLTGEQHALAAQLESTMIRWEELATRAAG